MVRTIVGATLFLLSSSGALGDILPPGGRQPPVPPPPSGAQKAVVRNVTVANHYGYWQGRRWLVYVEQCPTGLANCSKGCAVTGVAAPEERVTSVADLIRLDRERTGKPLVLELAACGTEQLSLPAGTSR